MYKVQCTKYQEGKRRGFRDCLIKEQELRIYGRNSKIKDKSMHSRTNKKVCRLK